MFTVFIAPLLRCYYAANPQYRCREHLLRLGWDTTVQPGYGPLRK